MLQYNDKNYSFTNFMVKISKSKHNKCSMFMTKEFINAIQPKSFINFCSFTYKTQEQYTDTFKIKVS